jgi:cysteine synthase
VVLTPAEKGMNGAVAKAESIAANMEGGNAFILGQFNNPTNPKAHRLVYVSQDERIETGLYSINDDTV